MRSDTISFTPGNDGAALAGVTVYVDSNGNNMFDPGELSAVTNSAGLATAPVFTAGTAIGAYTVTASVPGALRVAVMRTPCAG